MAMLRLSATPGKPLMIEGLTLPTMLWIAGAVFAAYVVRGMSGFGAGLIASPLLAFVLPVRVVIPVSALLVFQLLRAGGIQ